MNTQKIVVQAFKGKKIKPNPTVVWSEIGHEEVKLAICLAAEDALSQNQMRSVLLYGPSGSGKTYLAEGTYTGASGSIRGINMFCVYGKDLISMSDSEAEKLLKGVFMYAHKQKSFYLLLDDIDLINQSTHPKLYAQFTKEVTN